jgi:hypothetical protein
METRETRLDEVERRLPGMWAWRSQSKRRVDCNRVEPHAGHASAPQCVQRRRELLRPSLLPPHCHVPADRIVTNPMCI